MTRHPCHPLTKQDTLHRLYILYHTLLLSSRSGYAFDIASEIKNAQAEIQQIQTQLEAFDNSSTTTSVYSQKHAVQADSLGTQLATARMLDSLPFQNMSKPSPFLFVGVLSVAGNAGELKLSNVVCKNVLSMHVASA